MKYSDFALKLEQSQLPPFEAQMIFTKANRALQANFCVAVGGVQQQIDVELKRDPQAHLPTFLSLHFNFVMQSIGIDQKFDIQVKRNRMLWPVAGALAETDQ